MGLLLLHPKSRGGYEDIIYDMDYTEGKRKQQLLYQGIIIKFKKIYKQFVFRYVRATPNNEETKEMLNKFMDLDGIVGDLNLNPELENEKKRLKTLCGNTKEMELKEITTRDLNNLIISC